MTKIKLLFNKLYRGLNSESCGGIGFLILFFASFGGVLFLNMMNGSMIDMSGDAADIWKTITTWYTDNRYPSYVLYKGFASVYPYVWFVQMANCLHINDFFFIMCYHAILYSYVAVVGIPAIVETITGYKPKIWQKAVLVFILFFIWNRYLVLSQLMVDLPSCAFFVMSAHCAILIGRLSGWKKYGMTILTGLLCGLIANISGQYSISALCIMIYGAVILWKTWEKKERTKNKVGKYILCLILLVISMLSIRSINMWFSMSVVEPLVQQGAWIPSGQNWMERALFYMLGVGRKFYGYDLIDHRGIAIVMDMYGETEGTQLIELAAVGGYGWSISQWFQAFFHYPIDFFLLFLNRMIIIVSDDCQGTSIGSLIFGYTLVYLALVTTVRLIKNLRDFFKPACWLVFGALTSVIPLLVMCVEMRFTISFQAFVYGIALMGPVLPQICKKVFSLVRQCWQNKSLKNLMDCSFSYELVCWVIFCVICLGYYGVICAGTENGSAVLFH